MYRSTKIGKRKELKTKKMTEMDTMDIFTLTVDWIINCNPRTPESFLGKRRSTFYFQMHLTQKRKDRINSHIHKNNIQGSTSTIPLPKQCYVAKLLN
jgi:hypothetical protein